MNARSIIFIAVLLVLGVALWSAIYYGTKTSDSASGISSPYSEFSATAMVNTDYGNYTIQLYSKLTFSGNDVSSWTLDAQVDYSDFGGNWRHLYTNGLIFYGKMEGNYFNISTCTLFDQANVLEAGSTSFVPTKIENAYPIPACPQCNVWSLTLAKETFLLLEIGGVPQNLISRDQTIYVTSFSTTRTFFAPTPSAAARALCEGNYGGPDQLPDNLNFTVQSEPVFNSQQFEPTNSVVSRHLQKIIAERATQFPTPTNLAVRTESASLFNSAAHPGFVTQGVCDASKKGDGYCHDECNNAENNYDNGDCCPGCCLTARNKPYACGSNKFNCRGGCSSRPCLFLHGLGGAGSRTGTFTQTKPPGSSLFGYNNYWGNLEQELQGVCGTFIYNYHDTTNYGWNDATLQNSYYDYAKAVQDQGGVIFAHSMANMILGGACMYNPSTRCQVSWYMLAGPIRGSSAANLQQQITKIFGGVNGGTRSLLTDVEGLGKGNSRRGELSNVIKGRLKGAACGRDAWGSGGVAGFVLYWVGRAVYGQDCTGGRSWFFNICKGWTDVPNDSVVGLSECQYAGGDSVSWLGSFSTSRSSTYFYSGGHHYDMATVNGNRDGIMEWVRNMAGRG